MRLSSPLTRTSLGLAIAAGLAFSSSVSAEALISGDLQARLASKPSHEVIVTFSDSGKVHQLLNLTPSTLVMQELPMVGAVLTSAQVREVASWDGVESLYFNAPLKYFNYEAGEITDGHKVHDHIGLYGNGVTVAVLDSGVDATHPDLPLGSKTVQNVKLIGDLGLVGVSTYLENQPNTDTSSGHGTHVAGTVGGTGAASANDPRRPNYYAGIAPEASLIGLGAGEAISILYALMGFDWALASQDRYDIDIITNSWGSSNSVYDPNNPINKASYEAYKRGMVVTFAAGNDGPGQDTLNPYAIVPWVINVGSGTKAGDLSGFSSRGLEGDFYKHIDVVAPGSSIVSTRALNTPLPVLGPVLDPTNPGYTAYYAGMSGTSMATPFVAGVAALLLEANPDLSPDQIERILVDTATPMPGYGYHEVGGGYINVLAAVDLASRTEGRRTEFLDGMTAWSSQGQWNGISDGDALLAYGGTWQTVAASGATDGSYLKSRVSKKSVPRVNLSFNGPALQLQYPRDNKGGLADVYIDGVFRGRMSFFNETADFGGRFAVNNLSSGIHKVEIRGIQGNVYFDGALLDGRLMASNISLTEQTETFTGLMGPSAENLQIDEIPFEVGQDTVSIRAALEWDAGAVDLDFYLLDPHGQPVASAASLDNPEVLEYAVTEPGTYTYQVTGYISVLSNYTVTSTQSKAVVIAE
ncbi:S8 family serine peptidase [Marilutibacter alkalisoli]|uniref:S8 family serine peptidase n=1 Tax=Marilutibacter alkalisoli TaxID=2591633 RepID=A0A514BS97_9GAMM|nr:S8 family serine peptidase [Lysobacter alkalisoli]QDH70240.1 S8 family serine peptidase [Lysobacter alkalisoli]